MAWDDAPPDKNLNSSGSWDTAAPDEDIANPPKTLGGFAENLGENALRAVNPLEIAKGLGSSVKQGLYDIPKAAAESSVDLLKGAAKAATGGGLPSMEEVSNTPILQKTREMTEPIAKDPVDFAYKNPIDAAMLVAAPVMGLMGGEAAEGAAGDAAEAAEAPKKLPTVEPGSTTGKPHALFAYNDKLSPEMPAESKYQVFGDPNDPVFKSGKLVHSSQATIDQLKDAGVPVVGRTPRSFEGGKWEPLDDLSAPAEAAPKNTIGNRLAARTTAQALDINPLAIRKLATKAGMTPEDYVLKLGDKAHELIPNLIEPMDSANSKFGKIIEAHDTAGEQIGKLTKSITKGTTPESLPEGLETINALRKAADEYYQVDGGDLALQKTADRLENLQKAGKLDFDRLSKVKSDIGKGFNKTDPPPGTEDIYHIIDDNAQKVVDRLSVQDTTLAPQLAHLKEMYTTTSRLIPAMARTAAKEVAGANVGGGLFSKVIPSAIGGAIGGPMGALGGAGAKLLQEAIAPDLGKNLAYLGMKASPKMIAAVQKAFPTLSKAAAAQVASRLASGGQSKNGMSKGGMVPDDVRRYVGFEC